MLVNIVGNKPTFTKKHALVLGGPVFVSFLALLRGASVHVCTRQEVAAASTNLLGVVWTLDRISLNLLMRDVLLLPTLFPV